MFDEKLLRELAAMEGQGSVLSVYLNVDPTRHTADAYKLTLRELLKQVEGEADTADIEAVKQYVGLEYDWTGRGLVFFSRQAENLWYPLVLSVPVRSGATVARKPYISPLVELDSLYGRYVVAVIDRQGARFSLFRMGEVITQEGVMGEEVRGTRKEKGSSMVGMRGGASGSKNKLGEVIQRNLRDTAEALRIFCERHHARRLLLAGTEENLAQFREFLPVAINDIVVGTFAADMGASDTDLRDHSVAILQQIGQQRKVSLVETVITAAAKGSNGVIRLGETLSAAHQGRVQVLVVERDYHEPGYRCSGCGYLTTQTLGTCPFCSSEFAEIADAAEAVVAQVVEKGGAVEVVENEAMGEARIGALLRY